MILRWVMLPLAVSAGGLRASGSEESKHRMEESIIQSFVNCPMCKGKEKCLGKCRAEGKSWKDCLGFCLSDNPMLADTVGGMISKFVTHEET
mmetsp:Transcript_44919/g.97612  ORF Transcript_44919/g.97612 Transcript_44919/m.97612 type:complete len:92 (+) Transcript_44919:59-334(+)